jgi:hypothetical protein
LRLQKGNGGEARRKRYAILVRSCAKNKKNKNKKNKKICEIM